MSGMEQWSGMASRTIRRLSIEELTLLNYGVGEDTWESLRESLRVWSARRSNQSVLKEISAENSLEGLMLKLNLQYFGIWCKALTHWKRLWCWERLKAEGEEDDRGWNSWMASLTWWTWVWASLGSWWWTGKLGVLQSWGHKKLDTTERLNNSYIFNFWETLYYFPKWLHQFTIPQQCMNIPFSLPHHQHIFFSFW